MYNMKPLITFCIILISTFTGYSVELPDKPNGRTSLNVSMFGATENPSAPPYYNFFTHEMRDDALLTSETKNNKKGYVKKRITKKEYAELYDTFKTFFNTYKIDEKPNLVRGGSSIKIQLTIGSQSFSSTFAHNSFIKSNEVKTLIKQLEQLHPGTTQSLLPLFK